MKTFNEWFQQNMTADMHPMVMARQAWEYQILQRDALIREIQEELSMALSGDLEQGVAWMNDEAWQKFGRDYPGLSKILDRIADIETGD